MPASGPPAREGADIETLDGQVVGTVRAPADTTDNLLTSSYTMLHLFHEDPLTGLVDIN